MRLGRTSGVAVMMNIAYRVKKGLYLNITNRCPCNCSFCLRNKAPGVYGSDSLWLDHEPSLSEVLAAVASAEFGTCEEVVFCGYGEPTERLDVMLAVAREIKGSVPSMPIRLNTNGLGDLINSTSIAPRLKGLVDTVSISLNSSNPDKYCDICRPSFGRQSWQSVVDFASSCRQYVPNVVFTIVGSPITTPDEQSRCKNIADSIGVSLRIRPSE